MFVFGSFGRWIRATLTALLIDVKSISQRVENIEAILAKYLNCNIRPPRISYIGEKFQMAELQTYSYGVDAPATPNDIVKREIRHSANGVDLEPIAVQAQSAQSVEYDYEEGANVIARLAVVDNAGNEALSEEVAFVALDQTPPTVGAFAVGYVGEKFTEDEPSEDEPVEDDPSEDEGEPPVNDDGSTPADDDGQTPA